MSVANLAADVAVAADSADATPASTAAAVAFVAAKAAAAATAAVLAATPRARSVATRVACATCAGVGVGISFGCCSPAGSDRSSTVPKWHRIQKTIVKQ
jgi:hypothetical protein